MLCYRCGSHVPDNSESCATCGQKLSGGGLRQATGTFSRRRSNPASFEGAPFKQGEVLSDRYTIKDAIGAGPVGFVFRAQDNQFDIEVALKVINPRLVQTSDERKQFAKAMRVGKKLSHPNVLKIYEEGEERDRPYFTTQLVEGLTLRKIIDLRQQKGQFFSGREIEPIIAQLANALDGAHKLGPHGDLKPENVIVLPDLLKLSDFGLGLAIPRLPFSQAMKPRKADRYLSPEYLEGGEIDHRTDIYALGVIMGEMLAGVTPDGAIPELTRIAPDLPPIIEGLYRKALNPNPLARFSTAGELHEEIARALGRTSPPPTRSRPEPASVPVTTPRPPPASGSGSLSGPHSGAHAMPHSGTQSTAQSGPLSAPHSNGGAPLALGASSQAPTVPVRRSREKPAPPVPPDLLAVPPPPPADATQPIDPADIPLDPRDLALRFPSRPVHDETEIIQSYPAQLPPDAPGPSEGAGRGAASQLDPRAQARRRATAWLIGLTVSGLATGTALGFWLVQRIPQKPVVDPAEVALVVPAVPDDSAAVAAAAEAERVAAAQRESETARLAEEARKLEEAKAAQAQAEAARLAEATRKVKAPEDARRAEVAEARRAEEAQRKADEAQRKAEERRKEEERRREEAAAKADQGQGKEEGKIVAAAGVTPPVGEDGCLDGMRLVASGPFKMGTSKDDPMMGFDERVLSALDVPAFCVDVYEYPNRRGQNPQVNVSWNDAKRLCEAKGKRLCGEEEWEKACKGPGNARFPYGNAFDADVCNTEDAVGEDRVPTFSGKFSRCRSGYGVADLSGNVAEWTATPYTGNADRTQKGGAYDKPDYASRCSARKSGTPGSRAPDVGFRCCADPGGR